MKDWQKRAIKEAEELEEKIVKLSEFLNSDEFINLDNEDKRLLTQQYDHMQDYHSVLRHRVDLFD